MEYKLLKTDNVEEEGDIETKVNEALSDGWSLHGITGIVTVQDHRARGGYRVVITQAMVKGAKSK